MDKQDSFFDNHFSFTGIGFGSKEKDDKVANSVKNHVKKGLNK